MMANLGLFGTHAFLCRCVQRMVGKCQHAALVVRHPLSLLEENLYSSKERKAGRFPWDSSRWGEFLAGIGLSFVGSQPHLRVQGYSSLLGRAQLRVGRLRGLAGGSQNYPPGNTQLGVQGRLFDLELGDSRASCVGFKRPYSP